jgi:hypothetical protein
LATWVETKPAIVYWRHSDGSIKRAVFRTHCVLCKHVCYYEETNGEIVPLHWNVPRCEEALIHPKVGPVCRKCWEIGTIEEINKRILLQMKVDMWALWRLG